MVSTVEKMVGRDSRRQDWIVQDWTGQYKAGMDSSIQHCTKQGGTGQRKTGLTVQGRT